MVKLVLLFKKPTDENAFEEAYNRSLAMLEQMPNILRRQANMVLGGPTGASPYYRILELYFQDFEMLDAALTTPQGTEAGQYLMSFAAELVELIFVDVFEDNHDTAPEPR